jgi:hypothetical protein
MKMITQTRQAVYKKFNGHCAYCGIKLTFGAMHIDHAIPKVFGGLDDYGNLMPSCHACNNYKSACRIEEFRNQLNKLFETKAYMFKSTVKARILEQFGVISYSEWNGKFYFEKEQSK